jgi:hypothetical protein
MKLANVLDNSENRLAGQPAGEGASTRLAKPEKLTVNASRGVAFTLTDFTRDELCGPQRPGQAGSEFVTWLE